MIRKQFRDDVVPAEELVHVMEEVVSTISYCNMHTRTKSLAKKVRRYGLTEQLLGITWRKFFGRKVKYTMAKGDVLIYASVNIAAQHLKCSPRAIRSYIASDGKHSRVSRKMPAGYAIEYTNE